MIIRVCNGMIRSTVLSICQVSNSATDGRVDSPRVHKSWAKTCSPKKAVNNNNHNNNPEASSKRAHMRGMVRAVLYDTVQAGRQSVDREAGQRAERPKDFLSRFDDDERPFRSGPSRCSHCRRRMAQDMERTMTTTIAFLT